jgi:hypothetical protein
MDPKAASLAQLARKCRVWAAALTLVTLWAQVATAIMAAAPTAPSDTKAQWNDEETTALADFLLEHKSEIGDAGMYKMGTFNAAAGNIAIHHTLGPAKTGKMCKTKWRAVCFKSLIQVVSLIVMPQFSSEPKFEPELLRTGPKFSSKFRKCLNRTFFEVRQGKIA